MYQQKARFLESGMTLMRSVAVVSSSVAAIISSLIPLLFQATMSVGWLFFLFIFLVMAAFTVHGVLTHALNDYADYYSGTDERSPGILSGGSRVIQTGRMSVDRVYAIGKWLTIILLAVVGLCIVLSYYVLALLLLIGIWVAVSYSLPPLRLSYRPILGEWLCLFPAIFFIGVAGPWIALDFLPLWAIQNAVVNSLFCMSWVMIHHIPDIWADKCAIPKKRTTVVWFYERCGSYFARMPAVLYLVIALTCELWIGHTRPTAAILTGIFIVISLFIVFKIDVDKHKLTSQYEKILLVIAVIIAIVLGVCVP